MPRGNNNKLSSIAMLLYGEPKTRKTWWALAAAEAGFNVHLFDGDKGGKIVKKLSPKARERVNIINCYDTETRAIFADFIIRFTKSEKILWDDDINRILPQFQTEVDKDHAYFEISLEKMTSNDVIIVDSIRALVYSTLWQTFADNNKDVAKFQAKPDWDVFHFQMAFLNTVLTRLRAAKCHLIVISHSDINELKEPKKNDKGEMERVPTGEVIKQPLSSSRSHGNSISGFFDDNLYFDNVGSNTFIDTQPNDERQAGSRSHYGRELWDKLQFGKFAELNGFVGNWDEQSKGCVYYPAGSLAERPGIIRKEVTLKRADNKPISFTPSKPVEGNAEAAAAVATPSVGIKIRTGADKNG